MNILFAIPWLSKSDGGIYQYSISILKELIELDHNFYVAWQTPSEEIVELSRTKDNLHLISGNQIGRNVIYKVQYYFSEALNHIGRVRGKSDGFTPDLLFNEISKKFKIDVIHSPTQAFYRVDGVASICTIHDVQELHFPQFFDSTERMNRATEYKRAIDNSEAVIVSFQHVKNDIVKYFDKQEDRVYVCPVSIKNLWFNHLATGELDEMNRENRYVLYPAATWPHKNHMKLLAAMKNLKDEGRLSFKLICTGHKTKHYEKLSQKIKSLGLDEDVQFRGIVNEHDLLTLYKNALAVVIPTLYEAGSFPLMESIIIGTPVICSNITSLTETMGNETFTFNPESEDEISRKLSLIADDYSFRNENIQCIKAQKSELLSRSVSEQFEGVYQRLNRQN